MIGKIFVILLAIVLSSCVNCSHVQESGGYKVKVSSNKTAKSFDPNFDKEPKYKQFGDSDYYVITEDFVFNIGEVDKETGSRPSITVPRGFVTNLASVPPVLSLFLDSPERYATAGIVHDYMFWIQPCGKNGKDLSDKLFKQLLKARYKKGGEGLRNNKFKVWWMNKILSMVPSWTVWNSNCRRRKKGKTRFVPHKHVDKVGKLTWDEFVSFYCLKQADFEKAGARTPHKARAICEVYDKYKQE